MDESDSDCSFDVTEDDILTPTPRNHVPKRKSQELLDTSAVGDRPLQPGVKRRPSGGFRRRSAQRQAESETESDSFWDIKTPQKIKLRDTTKSPNFIQVKKLKILVKNPEFGEKYKFWETSKFWLKIKFLVRNQIVGQKPNVWSEIEIVVENHNFGRKSQF